MANADRKVLVARPRSVALVVTGWYVVVGATWIMLTDVVLYGLANDKVLVAKVETAMGWLFVGLTALLMFAITNRAMRRQARTESTMSAVVDSIADGVLIVGRDHTIRSANAAAARMLGTRPSKLIGLGPEEFARRYHLTRPDGRIVGADQLISQRVLTGEQPRSYRAHFHPASGGPELVALCTAAPVRTEPAGPVVLAVSVLHDVTELDQLDHLRDQFFASAAHALKTPLTVIRAQAHVLALDPTRSAEVIDRQCGRLGRLIENVITLVRLRTGNLELRPEAADCAVIVADVGREMSTAHGQHGLAVNIEGRPVVFADPDAFAHVVRNLIEVAYRCSVPGTDVRVTVDETDACARIRITYQPLELMHGVIVEAAGYEGLSVERHVVESLVRAMCGVLRSSLDMSTWTDWVEIPKVVNDAVH